MLGLWQMYGARPIRRWVQKNVMTVLSRMLLKGEAVEGSTIVIDATDDKRGLRYEVVNPQGKSPVVELSCDKSYVAAVTNPKP